MSNTMEKSDDDCYFYYYSTCTKGDDCPYRHCQLALGSEVTCTHWQNGKCLRPSVCKYRHMESRINRSSIQCWFETQPIGCRKPHCVFSHKKPRSLALDEEQLTSTVGLILPVVTTVQTAASANSCGDNCTENGNNRDNSPNVNNTTINPNVNNSVNCLKRSDDTASKMKLFDDSDYLNQSMTSFNESSANIEPISISLNDCDEESDNESEKNSDQKSDESQTKTEFKTNQNRYNSGDYGIKTLEQIRMEKVFNSQTEDTLIDEEDQCFDNFSSNESQIMTQNKLMSNKDLRVKIRRQKFSNPSASNLNRNTINTSTEPLPDFGIKSLDQIRKEREGLAQKNELIAEQQNGLKENQEPKGQKRASTDLNNGSGERVIKIRRTGPIAVSSLKVQQKTIECKDNCNQSIETNCEQNLSSSESSNQSNVVSSTDTTRKHRINSIDTDLDDFDLFDGTESAQNIDSNEAIDDDEDDELMREINQVINS